MYQVYVNFLTCFLAHTAPFSCPKFAAYVAYTYGNKNVKQQQQNH